MAAGSRSQSGAYRVPAPCAVRGLARERAQAPCRKRPIRAFPERVSAFPSSGKAPDGRTQPRFVRPARTGLLHIHELPAHRRRRTLDPGFPQRENAMKRIRIVVADQAEAIFYDTGSLTARPVEAGRMADPAAHLHNRDFTSDRPAAPTRVSARPPRDPAGERSPAARKPSALRARLRGHWTKRGATPSSTN